MSWSKNCVISEISRIPDLLASSTANPPNDRVALTQTNGATFEINNAKLHVPIVTLSVNDNMFLENLKQDLKRTVFWQKYRSDNINLLENLKQDFKRTIFWKKYRSEMVTQNQKTIWIT